MVFYVLLLHSLTPLSYAQLRGVWVFLLLHGFICVSLFVSVHMTASCNCSWRSNTRLGIGVFTMCLSWCAVTVEVCYAFQLQTVCCMYCLFVSRGLTEVVVCTLCVNSPIAVSMLMSECQCMYVQVYVYCVCMHILV